MDNEQKAAYVAALHRERAFVAGRPDPNQDRLDAIDAELKRVEVRKSVKRTKGVQKRG